MISDEWDAATNRTPEGLHEEKPVSEAGDGTLKWHTVLFLASLSQLKRVRVRNEVNLIIYSAMFKCINHMKIQFL